MSRQPTFSFVGSSLRALAVVAVLAAVCGASSPAWCAASQSLWVADSEDNRVVELTPADLSVSGAPTPTVLNSAVFNVPSGVAFDSSRNLWVTTFENSVFEFTAAQLADLGSVSNPAPTVTIRSSSFLELVGCTFDKNGNLWVIDGDDDGVHELTQAQLAAGSNSGITPAVTVSSSTLDFPDFGVFDKSGNLWVSAEDSSNIAEFTAKQLRTSGSKTPHVLLTTNGSNSLDDPGQLAFDKSGNLWVTDYGTGTVVMFPKSKLHSTGGPKPKVILSGSAFDGPWGLAMDSAKDLWISNYSSGVISKFTTNQLKMSNAPTPPVVLTGVLFESYQMTFGPVF